MSSHLVGELSSEIMRNVNKQQERIDQRKRRLILEGENSRCVERFCGETNPSLMEHKYIGPRQNLYSVIYVFNKTLHQRLLADIDYWKNSWRDILYHKK